MKTAVITGASSGIGKEFVIELDKRDDFDEMWIIARRVERLNELRDACRHTVKVIALDLADEGAYEIYAKILEDEKPEIRYLVNAAGCGIFGPFDESDLKKQINCMKLNTIALMAMCRISLPYMKSGDAIINVGSNSSWQPVPYQSVYGSSKSCVLSFSRAIGRELRYKGIHVMCVCPGWIRTEFQKEAEHDKYIRYVDRWYDADQVAIQAMKDLKKRKAVSILGHPVRRQVRLVKLLPVDLVMKIWCKQQGIK